MGWASRFGLGFEVRVCSWGTPRAQNSEVTFLDRQGAIGDSKSNGLENPSSRLTLGESTRKARTSHQKATWESTWLGFVGLRLVFVSWGAELRGCGVGLRGLGLPPATLHRLWRTPSGPQTLNPESTGPQTLNLLRFPKTAGRAEIVSSCIKSLSKLRFSGRRGGPHPDPKA